MVKISNHHISFKRLICSVNTKFIVHPTAYDYKTITNKKRKKNPSAFLSVHRLGEGSRSSELADHRACLLWQPSQSQHLCKSRSASKALRNLCEKLQDLRALVHGGVGFRECVGLRSVSLVLVGVRLRLPFTTLAFNSLSDE